MALDYRAAADIRVQREQFGVQFPRENCGVSARSLKRERDDPVRVLFKRVEQSLNARLRQKRLIADRVQDAVQIRPAFQQFHGSNRDARAYALIGVRVLDGRKSNGFCQRGNPLLARANHAGSRGKRQFGQQRQRGNDHGHAAHFVKQLFAVSAEPFARARGEQHAPDVHAR
ncbi:hypothetical protein SDC9_127752 [bioreactor metagenome]|uniref:Uncharacterized protein n=1 Tax=bioreactor metagenome TaxID=1076179 RepID=A0A645CVI2_9ZZZZ